MSTISGLEPRTGPCMDSESTAAWLSQSQAAALVGVKVATVEFAARAGKFVKRDQAPSLRRDSVLAWAQKRTEQRVERAERLASAKAQAPHAARARRPAEGRPAAKREPLPEGWIPLAEAAAILGVSVATAIRHGRAGQFAMVKVAGRYGARQADVRAYADDRRRWVSAPTAAAIIGCREETVRKAARAGLIERRRVARMVPSLLLESVERYAAEREQARLVAAQRRPERQERAARARAAARAPGPSDSLSVQPGADVWLDRGTAALVLGLSKNRIGQLTAQGRIPATRSGRRWWYRRSHVEQLAAARAFQALRRGGLASPSAVSSASRE